MSAYILDKASMMTGRQMVMFAVVGLHALVIGTLMTMTIDLDAPAVPSVFKPVTSIDTPKPLPDERPTIETHDARQIVFVVPDGPLPDIQMEVKTGIVLDDPPISPGGDAGSSQVNDLVAIAPTELRYRATRAPEEYYPATSIQLQEEGVAIVRVCVGPTGRMEGRPTIDSSSGSRRLDAAAQQWAREALAFTPATRNGSAVSACKGFRVSFNLQ